MSETTTETTATSPPPPAAAAELRAAATGESAAAKMAAGAQGNSPATPKPAIGRIVHYWPRGSRASKGQPYAASITHVHTDGTVNLYVADDGGFPLPGRTPRKVPQLSTPGQEEAWEWPPRV